MLPLFDRTGHLPRLLEDALDRGALILTANLRAARALQTAYAEDQRSRGILAWPQPRILDWHSWVGELWEQYAWQADQAPMPLTPLQEQQLWLEAQSADRHRVVAPDRMAELAQQAYGLLGSYHAHALRKPAAAEVFANNHEDAERFLVWAATFDGGCQKYGWISRTRLEELLSAGLGLLDPVPELYLVGFDRTTPAQLQLLRALDGSGTRVTQYANEVPAGKAHLLRAKDQRAELEACAWWCRAQLVEDATRRIGIIAPDLGRVRAELDRVFRRILMPQTTMWPTTGSVADAALRYEFSLGVSLATVPIVRAALLLLGWLARPLASAELTWLLTSGWIAGSAADRLGLARLDAELRREVTSPEISLAWLLERPYRFLPAPLRQRLVRLQASSVGALVHPPGWHRGSNLPDRRASYAHWAELVPSLLREAGWPGFREIDSVTFQAQERWASLLGELAELGFAGSQPTWNEFLRTLEAQAHAVIFAVESAAPPIQILGAFESSGQSFDAVWFLGGDDGHWPSVGRLHPLLPAWLQREAEMPHASPDADWLLAQQATARIVASAPVVVMSYPGQDASGELRPSPLLLAHAEGPAAEIPAHPAPRLSAVSLETIADESGLVPWPAIQGAGGAEVLKRQAACAFQSFATLRLGARPLEQSAQGLDAAERGTKLHAVLERLWSSVPATGDGLSLHTRDDLRRVMRNGSVAALLKHHIEAVFAPLRSAAQADPWNTAYLACEQRRVHDRLLTWLGCELQRQPFTVTAVEKELTEILVGTLRLAVRLDRVDRLADGTHLLIDYKTGTVQANAWMGARPKEPQLPLYAIFGGVANVSGVAFAQIRAEDTRLVARAADPAAMVSETLGPISRNNLFDDAVRDEWREALLGLAEQFGRGEANVNPRNGAVTCNYCPLGGLCRVHAGGARQEQVNGADGD